MAGDSTHVPRTSSRLDGIVLRCETCDETIAFYGHAVVVSGGLIAAAMEAHRAKKEAK